jgi:hypothetical protein
MALPILLWDRKTPPRTSEKTLAKNSKKQYGVLQNTYLLPQDIPLDDRFITFHDVLTHGNIEDRRMGRQPTSVHGGPLQSVCILT